MKRTNKILLIILSIITILITLMRPIEATTRNNIKVGTQISEEQEIKVQSEKKTMADEKIDPDKYKPSTSDADSAQFNSMANKLIGLIRYIGSIVSVLALIILGIKYMLGSIEEKAEYKKSMKPYLIGFIILFAGTNLLQIIYDLVTNITKTI